MKVISILSIALTALTIITLASYSCIDSVPEVDLKPGLASTRGNVFFNLPDSIQPGY